MKYREIFVLDNRFKKLFRLRLTVYYGIKELEKFDLSRRYFRLRLEHSATTHQSVILENGAHFNELHLKPVRTCRRGRRDLVPLVTQGVSANLCVKEVQAMAERRVHGWGVRTLALRSHRGSRHVPYVRFADHIVAGARGHPPLSCLLPTRLLMLGNIRLRELAA